MRKSLLQTLIGAQYALYEQLFVRDVHRTDPAGVPSKVSTIPIGSVAYASLGTSAVHAAGTWYIGEIYFPRSKLITGIGVLNGATAATDKILVALWNARGQKLMTGALAGVTASGVNAFQEFPFIMPYQLMNDGVHYVGFQANGTTTTTRRVAASTFLLNCKSLAGTFGTVPNIAVPTTFAADVGPIAYCY